MQVLNVFVFALSPSAPLNHCCSLSPHPFKQRRTSLVSYAYLFFGQVGSVSLLSFGRVPVSGQAYPLTFRSTVN